MKLLRTDVNLLVAAEKSNGGGTNDWRHAPTTIQRMIKAGLVQWKPHHATLITITPAGKKALEEFNQSLKAKTP